RQKKAARRDLQSIAANEVSRKNPFSRPPFCKGGRGIWSCLRQRESGDIWRMLMITATGLRTMRKPLSTIVLAVAAALASGCMVGPDYVKPKAETPDAYKENADWKVADPQDHLPRGKWWEIFGDPQLTGYIEQIDISNQNIRIAEASFRQARAL